VPLVGAGGNGLLAGQDLGASFAEACLPYRAGLGLQWKKTTSPLELSDVRYRSSECEQSMASSRGPRVSKARNCPHCPYSRHHSALC
jgi:hypothetical protein